jgi:hypothetical protein
VGDDGPVAVNVPAYVDLVRVVVEIDEAVWIFHAEILLGSHQKAHVVLESCVQKGFPILRARPTVLSSVHGRQDC